MAVIIPSLKGATATLEQAIMRQTWEPDDLVVVKDVRPNGRARNLGVERTKAGILVFIDDDAVPGSDHLIKALVQPLLTDQTIGVTGAARVLPKDASWFQQRVAAEIPRTVNRIPVRDMETNPPLRGYGHSQITTTCCAMRRTIYTEAGRFREDLISGVDADLFYRIRKKGLRFVMVPKVYVEHPAPANLMALLRKFHWYGQGYAQETQREPERNIGPRLTTALHCLGFVLAASLWIIPNIFIPYSPSYPHLRLGFRPVKALSTYAVAWGYARGWRKGLINANNT